MVLLMVVLMPAVQHPASRADLLVCTGVRGVVLVRWAAQGSGAVLIEVATPASSMLRRWVYPAYPHPSVPTLLRNNTGEKKRRKRRKMKEMTMA